MSKLEKLIAKHCPDGVEWLMGFPTGWTNPEPLTNIEIHHPDFWAVEPDIPRLTDVKTHRVARLKGLGNAQVPICAATAFQILAWHLCKCQFISSFQYIR